MTDVFEWTRYGGQVINCEHRSYPGQIVTHRYSLDQVNSSSVTFISDTIFDRWSTI